MYGLFRLFEGTRAIDWLILIVDFLILVSIVWLELPDWLHHRRAVAMSRALTPFMDRGRQLQVSVPSQNSHPSPELLKWAEEVKTWTEETEIFLARSSRKAAIAFTHVINAYNADRTVRRPDGTRFRLAGHYGDIYQVLQVKLDNLEKIIEKPEAYF